MTYTPSPGIALVKPFEENKDKFKLTDKIEGRIYRGEIITMGADDKTGYGEPIVGSEYGKAGDVIWFMHYYQEGGVDMVYLDNVLFYVVKWQDFRLVENA